jgi:hypothetical protein
LPVKNIADYPFVVTDSANQAPYAPIPEACRLKNDVPASRLSHSVAQLLYEGAWLAN